MAGRRPGGNYTQAVKPSPLKDGRDLALLLRAQRDDNLRAAIVHGLADAAVSVFVIVIVDL